MLPTALITLSISSIVMAIPTVTPVLMGAGDCTSYPNSYFHAGDNADAFTFHPDQVDDPSLNGLQTGIVGNDLSVWADNSTNPYIFCCDHGGTIFNAYETASLLFTSSSQLSFTTIGSNPQTYAHKVNGTTMDGFFLGKNNITTWGFGKKDGYWDVRLLSNGTKIAEGEVMGFLKVGSPPAP